MAIEKIVTEGWLCQSKAENDDWRRDDLISSLPPIQITDRWGDTIIVPPEGATWRETTDVDDIVERMTYGKRYRITIEEMPDGS